MNISTSDLIKGSMFREALVHLKKRGRRGERSYDPIRDRNKSVHCMAKALSDRSRYDDRQVQTNPKSDK